MILGMLNLTFIIIIIIIIMCRFGPRFPPLTTVYDKELRKLTIETAHELGMDHYIQVYTSHNSLSVCVCVCTMNTIIIIGRCICIYQWP